MKGINGLAFEFVPVSITTSNQKIAQKILRVDRLLRKL